MRIIITVFVLFAMLPSFSFAQSCDYQVELIINGTEFTIESFKWKMKAIKIEGGSTNITGTARIEDLSGNIIKSYKPWTSQSISKQKTSNEYSPNLKEGDYRVISEIEVECYDSNKNNNIAVKSIRIQAEELLENKIVQQENSQNATTEFSAQEIKEAAYTIENETIGITKNESETYSNIISLKKDVEEENDITAAVVQKDNDNDYAYISSNEKSKKLIIYLLLGISAIIIVALIWKR